jgi:hypothetical protein
MHDSLPLLIVHLFRHDNLPEKYRNNEMLIERKEIAIQYSKKHLLP